MTLQPAYPRQRERILMYGPFAAGKTTAWLNIAYWLDKTDADAKFYVWDTDDAVERMLHEGYPQLVDRVIVRKVYQWEDYEAAAAEFIPIVRPFQDWLVVDFMGSAWEAIQDWYSRKFFGESLDDFFVSARQAGIDRPLEGWKDWSLINRVYRDWVQRVVFNNQAHLFATAVSESIRDTDERQLKAVYAGVGFRPKGQKHLGHQFHTVLFSQAMRPGEVMVTTVKDRERQPMVAKVTQEFAIDYLVGVAGWQV